MTNDQWGDAWAIKDPEERRVALKGLKDDLNRYINATPIRVARWSKAKQQAFFEATGSLPHNVTKEELYAEPK